MGNCLSLLTLQGSAPMLSLPEATLFCNNVLTSVPPCISICTRALEYSFIDCKFLEDRDMFLLRNFLMAQKDTLTDLT